MNGSSVVPSELKDLPYTECAWAAATTSGRARWTWEWMANAAWLTGQSPYDDLAGVVDADQVRGT